MNTNSRFTPLFVVLALFALYLTIKWTCRLIFGLLDYALLIGFLCAIVWYIKLPETKRTQFKNTIKVRIKSIFN